MTEITVGGEEPLEPKRSLIRAYDPAIAETILMAVAEGQTLREIAKKPGMPTKSTVQRWIMKHPELAQAWKAAREMSAASLEDEALDMARDLKDQKDFTGTQVRAFEVAMNQFRWSASHRDPSTYGQTAIPNLVVPIQIITSLDIGQGGVKTETQTNTYEVAAKINQDYNALDAQVEGTDAEVEQGTPVAALPDDNWLAPVKPAAVRLHSTGGRPLKGHRKSPAKVAEARTRFAKKGLK